MGFLPWALWRKGKIQTVTTKAADLDARGLNNVRDLVWEVTVWPVLFKCPFAMTADPSFYSQVVSRGTITIDWKWDVRRNMELYQYWTGRGGEGRGWRVVCKFESWEGLLGNVLLALISGRSMLKATYSFRFLQKYGYRLESCSSS